MILENQSQTLSAEDLQDIKQNEKQQSCFLRSLFTHVDLSPPSAQLHSRALHRGLQASSAVSLATGAMCRLSKLLFLHRVSLAARKMFRKQKKEADQFQHRIEFQQFTCAAHTAKTKKDVALPEISFFKHLYGPWLSSAEADREGARMAMCAWPRRTSRCHGCLHTKAWSQEICIPAIAASSPAGQVDVVALGKQLAHRLRSCHPELGAASELRRTAQKFVKGIT